MKIRELLQGEHWSKRMTRRVFVGLGVFLGAAVVGFALWSVVDRNWIASGERSAARVALRKLDALQDAGFLNDKEFDVWAKLAARRVDDARQAARTTRDRKIVAELMRYQSTIVANHAFQKKQVISQQQDSSRKPGQGFALSGIDYDSRGLHKALD
jgi:hypothetical protein